MEGLRVATRAIAERAVLRVSVPTYLSTAWLMPRLSEFELGQHGLRIDLLHRSGAPELRKVDAAIFWADDVSAVLNGTPLFDTRCVPVAAPDAAVAEPLWESGLAPLHYRDRVLWRQWLQSAGAPADCADRGEVFDDSLLVLEAAVHRRGIVMGFLPFVSAQIDAGRLVRAHPTSSGHANATG
jgi:LysR family transcriptional regulator, glycine cleavage system transcriptional activator